MKKIGNWIDKLTWYQKTGLSFIITGITGLVTFSLWVIVADFNALHFAGSWVDTWTKMAKVYHIDRIGTIRMAFAVLTGALVSINVWAGFRFYNDEH